MTKAQIDIPVTSSSVTGNPVTDTVTDRVRERVADVLGGRRLDPADDAIPLADLDPERYDSLGVLDCVGGVEDEFEIAIDLVDDDLRVTFRSVASISDLVRRRLADADALGWS